MQVLFLTVPSLFLWLSKNNYPIYTPVQYRQQISKNYFIIVLLCQKHFTPNKISNSYGYMTSYPIDILVFQGIKPSIGINFSTNDLDAPLTLQNGAKNSVIINITTPFSFSNIATNNLSVKSSTQYSISNFSFLKESNRI